MFEIKIRANVSKEKKDVVSDWVSAQKTQKAFNVIEDIDHLWKTSTIEGRVIFQAIVLLEEKDIAELWMETQSMLFITMDAVYNQRFEMEDVSHRYDLPDDLVAQS